MTTISTPGWLSLAVENICDFLVGMVVLRGIIGVATPPERLDAERERGHVEQEHVLHVALEHAALDGGADGDDFVRVDALVRRLAAEVLGDVDDLGHAGHAADEHEFVDLARRSMPASLRQFLNGLDACARTARRRAAPSWRG